MLAVYAIIILTLVSLFIISLFLRLYANISYTYINGNGYLHIELKILGVKVFKKEFSHKVPGLQRSEQLFNDPESFYDHIKTLLRTLEDGIKSRRNLLTIFKQITRLLSKFTVHTFSWETIYGTGDASSTGVCYGLVSSFKQMFFQFLNTYIDFNHQPDITIVPLFQQKQLQTQVECMVSINLGQAMYAFLHLSKYFQTDSNRKSGKVWQI